VLVGAQASTPALASAPTSTASTPSPASGAVALVQALGCGANLSLNTAGGRRLVNNTWNQAAAGSRAWSQCLQQRGSGSTLQLGWTWRWPDDGTQVFAYPEIVIGAKPWDAGPGNDARFPRRVADTHHLAVSYDVQTTRSGNSNLALSIWLIRTPQVAAVPVIDDITTEIMVWTDYSAAMVSNDGSTQKRGEISVGGRVWEVWAAESWGDASNGTSHRWTFVTYVAKTTGTTVSVDAKAFLDDAVARGLASADHYVASVELGNEIASGSGSTWVRALSVTLD